MKNCFLINVHERPEVVINQVCNIKIVAPNSVIVLHISGSTKDSFLQECSGLKFDFFKIVEKMDCVINPENLQTKWGSKIFEAFESSFKYLCSLGMDKDIKKIILNASNQLYFKNLEEHLDKYDSGVYNTQPYKNSDSYPENNLVKHICGDPTYWTWSWHEGSFYKIEDFKQILDYLEFAKKNNICYSKYPDGQYSEEVTPNSIYNAMVKDKNISRVNPLVMLLPHGIYNFATGIDAVKDVLFNDNYKWTDREFKQGLHFYGKEFNLKNFYGIKPVQRSIDCPVRRYITSILPKHELDTVK